MYYTYMLYCKDGSIYTGIAKDIDKRMADTHAHMVRKDLPLSGKAKINHVHRGLNTE